MKKKIILSLVIVISIVLVVAVSIPVINHLSGHRFYNDIMVSMPNSVYTEETEGRRIIYTPVIFSGGKGMDVTEDEEKKMELIGNELKVFTTSFKEEHKSPFYIEARWENKDGKTVITYRGEITNPKTGEKEPYEKIFEYDFILTKDIKNMDLSKMKYFH